MFEARRVEQAFRLLAIEMVRRLVGINHIPIVQKCNCNLISVSAQMNNKNKPMAKRHPSHNRLQKLLASPYQNGVGMVADLLHRRGWVHTSITLLRFSIAVIPNKAGLVKRLTDILIANGQESLALSVVGKESRRAPTNTALRAHLAAMHDMLGNANEAAEIFSLVSEEAPEKRRFEAKKLWEEKRYAEIVSTLSDTGSFEIQRTNAYYAMGDIEGAHKYYRTRPRSLLLAHAFNQPHPSNLHIAAPGNTKKSAFVMVDSGIGDEIRMTSLYTQIASHFSSIVMTCDPRMLTLLQRSFPQIEFIAVPRHRKLDQNIDMSKRRKVRPSGLQLCLTDEAYLAARESDVVFSLIDALAELRTERTKFHNSAALHPDLNLTTFWREETASDRQKIGIAWRSLLQSRLRNVNYFRVEDLAELSVLDADFWIMQPFASEQELRELGKWIDFKIPKLDLKDDIEGQAAFAKSMDLVMSPLTTTAELTASVGTCTLFLAPTRETSWRMNRDGRDVWHSNGWLIQGSPPEDRTSLLNKAVMTARELLADSKGTVSQPFSVDCRGNDNH